MKKQTFKEFLGENGFPFLNVVNDELETIFGHKKKDIIKPKKAKDDKSEEETKEQKTGRKLVDYLRYAKNINEGEQK